MVDISGALGFVRQHGRREHSALAAFATGGAAQAQVTSVLVLLQAADGGWAGLAPGVPTRVPTLTGAAHLLQWMRWLSADQHPMIDRTAAYLAAHQHPDGYWDELAGVRHHNPPPGMVPGEPATRVLLTAAIARRLLETGRETEVYFGPALSYLSNAWARGTVAAAPVTALAMMLPLFKIGGQPSDAAVVEGCHAALLAAVARQDTPAPDVITIAHAALNTRYAGNDLYIAARDKALTMQAADGGWAAPGGVMFRVHATLDALMLLRWGGLL